MVGRSVGRFGAAGLRLIGPGRRVYVCGDERRVCSLTVRSCCCGSADGEHRAAFAPPDHTDRPGAELRTAGEAGPCVGLQPGQRGPGVPRTGQAVVQGEQHQKPPEQGLLITDHHA